MKKRLFAMLLVLALAAGLCPMAVAAGKLSTPTDLAWGWSYGLYAMNYVKGSQAGIVRFAVYKDDHLLVQDEFESSRIDVSCFFAEHDLALDSGVYHFTVQNIVDYGSDSADNSDVAVSPKWDYTAPDVQLAPPTDLSWDFPHYVWRRGSDVYDIQQAEFQLYFCESADGDYQMVADPICDLGVDAVRVPVDIWALEEYGAGYYKFRVINLSDDLDRERDSPWSAFSEPYYYDGSPVEVCEHQRWITPDDEKMPTCTEPGYSRDVICADCGEVILYAQDLPALGHDPNAEGVCQRYGCGARVEDRKGTLGEGSGALTWTYTGETKKLTFHGVIPVGETVFVACYEDGRFTGVKAATSGSSTVEVDTASDRLRLFWLDGSHAPKCQDVSFTLGQ